MKKSPLAARLRPRTLDEFYGQQHLVGPGRLLRRAIEQDQLSSLILFGPPGTGKTTLATIIAHTTRADFLQINAGLAGVKDIRSAIDAAKENLDRSDRRTIVFIDEVHRFNKAQQDVLLPHVESGNIIFIGATTENPLFEVNKALLSRARIFQLYPLEDSELKAILHIALTDRQRGYGDLSPRISQKAEDHLIRVANGDARTILNALEAAVESAPSVGRQPITIDLKVAEDSVQKRAILYDRDGDVHYDTVSAFIKSLRGSDPDAGLYWLAKMVEAGEDPRFLFRRMLIFASEDVGLADPQALPVVAAAARAFEYVGMPEGQYFLAEACLYLSTAPKSNSTQAYFSALSAVRSDKTAATPDHLKDSSRDGSALGHGKDYLYPHNYPGHWVPQAYLPPHLSHHIFYKPGNIGYEAGLREKLQRHREEQLAAYRGIFSIEGALPLNGETAFPRVARRDPDHRKDDENPLGQAWGKVRDHVFNLAQFQRDSLALVLHADSGLLLFEAVRQTPEGTVYGLVDDLKHQRVLEQNVRRFERWDRPILFLGPIREFEDKLQHQEGGREIHFDRCVGFRLSKSEEYRHELLDFLSKRLTINGIAVLADVEPRHTSRFSQLIDWTPSESVLEKTLKTAEEKLVSDPLNIKTGWSPQDFAQQAKKAGFGDIQILQEWIDLKMLMDMHRLSSWINNRNPIGRKSLWGYLEECSSKLMAEQIADLIKDRLSGKTVAWRCRVAFVVLQHQTAPTTVRKFAESDVVKESPWRS